MEVPVPQEARNAKSKQPRQAKGPTICPVCGSQMPCLAELAVLSALSSR